MLVSDLCSSEYLLPITDFQEIQWTKENDVPLTFGAVISNGLVLATKERKMLHKDIDGVDRSLWMFRFYLYQPEGGIKQFFWFSKNGDNVGDLEIQHLNENLIKNIRIEWTTLRK